MVLVNNVEFVEMLRRKRLRDPDVNTVENQLYHVLGSNGTELFSLAVIINHLFIVIRHVCVRRKIRW